MISAVKDIIAKLSGSEDTQKLLEKSIALEEATNKVEQVTFRNIENLLTAINENVFKLAEHVTGSATSLEAIERILSAGEAAKEFEKSSTATPTATKEITKPSAMEELFDRINKYLSLVSAVLLPLLGGFVLGFKKWVDEKFGEFWGNVYLAFSALMAFSSNFRKLVFSSISGLFRMIGSLFSGDLLKAMKAKFAGWIDNVVSGVSKAFSFIGKIFSSIGKVFSFGGEGGTISKLISKVTGMFSGGGGIFKTFTKLLKGIPVIGQIFAVVMGVFDGIKGAIEGYEEGGILGALRGALAGVISGLIGWIGDITNWLVGSLLELLGFEELGKQIKEFDFTKFVSDAVKFLFDNIVEAITNPVKWITSFGDDEEERPAAPDPGRRGRIASMQRGVEFARGQEGVVAVEAMMAEEGNQGGTFSDSVRENFNEALEDNDFDEMHEVLKEAGITDAAQRDQYITYRVSQKQLESEIQAENAAPSASAPAAAPAAAPVAATATPAQVTNITAANSRSSMLSQQASTSYSSLTQATQAQAARPANVVVSAPSSTTTNVSNNNQNLYGGSAAFGTEFAVALA